MALGSKLVEELRQVATVLVTRQMVVTVQATRQTAVTVQATRQMMVVRRAPSEFFLWPVMVVPVVETLMVLVLSQKCTTPKA